MNNGEQERVVVLKNLSLGLGGKIVLDNISFEIGTGEFVAILGPNGTGKTTLLRLLLGLLKPSSGTVTVLGRPPQRGNAEIGYAPQHRVLEADLALRARDVVGFGLDGDKWGIGLPNRRRDEKINYVLKEVDAYQFRDAPVGRLSGGEQQRLLIAQALITDPKILLLDEPLSNLDLAHAQEIVALLEKISRERHVTILLVAHDVNPLITSVTRVLYMANGKSAIGTPDDVITTETLSKLYDTKVEVVRSAGRVFVVGAET